MIIPNLLFYWGSMLVIDPKGELTNITARRRAMGLTQKVYVLDHFERTGDWVKHEELALNTPCLGRRSLFRKDEKEQEEKFVC